MIHLSTAATQEIRRLQSAHHSPQSYLRLAIAPGGCQEWAYVLEFVDTETRRDRLYETNQEMQIAIAPADLPHLEQLTLDYAEDLMGGSFRFDNPNITQTCGCGHSFTLPPASTGTD